MQKRRHQRGSRDASKCQSVRGKQWEKDKGIRKRDERRMEGWRRKRRGGKETEADSNNREN